MGTPSTMYHPYHFQFTTKMWLMLFFFFLIVTWSWMFLNVEYCKVPSVLTEEDTWFGEDNCPDRVSTVTSILTNKHNWPGSVSTVPYILTNKDNWFGRGQLSRQGEYCTVHTDRGEHLVREGQLSWEWVLHGSYWLTRTLNFIIYITCDN